VETNTQIFVRVGDDTIDAIVKGRIRVRPGDQIELRIDSARVHVFDSESGVKL
jgi:multiple sugar transport system ATP-binding protein